MSVRNRLGAVYIAWLFLTCLCLHNGRESTAQELWTGGTDFPATSSYWSPGSGGNDWLGSSGTNNRWQLGVEGANTDVGVSVNRVNAGSAAARAGIMPRDVIACVGGVRVGRVGPRVFDLAEQISKQVNSRGQVELLVQTSRTMQLRSMSVQLDNSTQSGLTGTLLLPGNARLPRDAVVTVQLENVSRPHYVVRNGEYAFRPPAYSNRKIDFTLNFDQNYVFANDTYRLNAYITARGQTLYVASRPEYVLTRGNPTRVQMQMVPSTSIATVSVSDPGNGNVYSAGYTNYDLITERVTQAYQRYLDRQPSSLELAAWHQIPDVEFRLSRLPLELMASQEYFDRIGDNNSLWIRKIFGEFFGRTPTALEFDQWIRRFADVRYSRMEVLKQAQSVAGSP